MLSDALQILFVLWVTVKILKLAVKRKLKKRNKMKGKYTKKKVSLLGKVWILISRRLHSSLDGMIRKQSESLREIKAEQSKSLAENMTQQSSKEKVIQFSKYQSKVVK